MRTYLRAAAFSFVIALPALAQTTAPAPATQPASTEIRVASYNIENWRVHFLAHKLKDVELGTDKALSDEVKRELAAANTEDNWEIAQVIRDPSFNPDILVFQEGCGQADLEYFNRRFLQNAYSTLISFPGNSTREQSTGLMMKPGFKVIEKRDQYFLEPDSVANDRGERLFARGPAFVLVESPSGYRFWVGTNHFKSKSGNSVDVTKWRNREAIRVNAIINELKATPTPDVIFLGDFNDEAGVQDFDAEGGGDTIANFVLPAGAADDFRLTLVTQPLIDAKATSFGAYDRPDRGLIDHAIATSALAPRVSGVSIVRNPWTEVASDHFPLLVTLKPGK